MSLALPQALSLAQRFEAKIGPACERIEVAGSIRRGRPLVKDIEIVAISRLREVTEQVNLFETRTHTELEVWHLLEKMRSEGAIKPITPGKAELIDDANWPLKAKGAKYLKLYVPLMDATIDLFLVTPETWGVLFTIRTGSSDFSRALVTHWAKISGGRVEDGRLCDHRGSALSTPEEGDVFRECRLAWVSPAERIGYRQLRSFTSRSSL